MLLERYALGIDSFNQISDYFLALQICMSEIHLHDPHFIMLMWFKYEHLVRNSKKVI
jgi:hypothetical protein